MNAKSSVNINSFVCGSDSKISFRSALKSSDKYTLDLTKTYISTILWFSPFFILNNIVLAFVRNDNCPRLAMMAMA